MTTPPALSAEILATLSNAVLKLDPLTEPRLQALEGRTVRLDIQMPGSSTPVRWLLSIDKASLQIDTCDECQAHAIVRGGLGPLISWLSRGDGRGLEFSGDELLLEQLAGLLTGYQPDLAQPLGRIIGEETATRLFSFAEAAGAAARSALQAAQGAAEATAKQHYTGERQLGDAIESLESLSLKVDRLQARTKLLEAAADSPADGQS